MSEASDSTVPWDHHPSIYEHLLAHLPPDGGTGLAEGGEQLPDEERVNAGSKIRFAAGASDGIHTHHFGGGPADDAADRLVAAVLAYAEAPTVAHKRAVYDLLAGGDGVIGLVDPFIKRLAGRPGVNWGRLHELAWSLATESPDREPVKWAIAVLGPFERDEDLPVLMALGRHDEFTLYSVVAVAGRDDAVGRIWELARNADGWGRVHAVERLAGREEPLPDDVRDWLLREGYRNGVLYEYTALDCATAGGLRAALDQPVVDDGLLAAAGDILEALLNGMPGPGIGAYDDAPAAARAYLRHLAARADPPVAAVPVVRKLRDLLAGDGDNDESTPDPAADNWPPRDRADVLAAAEAFLARPEWMDRLAAELRSEDPATFARVAAAAAAFDVDLWDVHWARVRADPSDPGRWYAVASRLDEHRIGPAVELAERTIPLDRVATGPADEMGLGPGFEPHNCVAYLLQGLGPFPGRGTSLVAAALRSPVVGNRNAAARVLSEWGEAHWPVGLRDAVAAAVAPEPNEHLRRRLQNLLAGRPLEDGVEA